jgi:hypothetical protein
MPTLAAGKGTDRPFGRALHDLLQEREEFVTGTGNVNWRAVAAAMHGVHYETLRKAVAGERMPAVSLIEQAATLAGVDPEYFVEFQAAQVMREFDVREVGFDEAVENLRLWAEAQKRKRR